MATVPGRYIGKKLEKEVHQLSNEAAQISRDLSKIIGYVPRKFELTVTESEDGKLLHFSHSVHGFTDCYIIGILERVKDKFLQKMRSEQITK